MTDLQKAALGEHAFFDEEACKAANRGDREMERYYKRLAEDARRQAYRKEETR